MKILAIRGKNLASLEGEFEIDFMKEPLRSAGIFAITGSTGSGKSTILDALCLALFDDTPRSNKAGENIQVVDVLDKTINQKDSRNILRRGATDGFAEVDFIALNGNSYRSRWMVRRARNKIDGALQNTEIRLYNLTSKYEEQGTKTEILTKITEIIGLTFDQFTRSILLAQGDFANFLKAKQSEKAELLEKLTGTEIYSRISAAIFKHNREAEQELNILLQRIQDVKILSEEELESIHSEKEKVSNELEPLKVVLSGIEKKLSWLKQEEQIVLELNNAEKEWKKLQETIKESLSRYDYIALIDQSQEIRETYLDWIKKKKQLLILNKSLEDKEKEAEKLDVLLLESEKEMVAAKNMLEVADKQYSDSKMEITKAKELDIKMLSAKEKMEDAKKEMDIYVKQKEQSQKSIETLKSQLLKIQQSAKSASEWLEVNKLYSEIVDRTDLIVSLLNDTHTAREQQTMISKNLENAGKELIIYQDKLQLLEKEAEMLKSLLPTEIINLRNKLEEGKECPVCGSIHHPFKVSNELHSNVMEAELEQKKKKNEELMENTGKCILNCQKVITQLETRNTDYKLQYDKSISKADTYLQALPDWRERFEKGSFQKELSGISILWKKNKELLDNSSQQAELISTKLDAENNSFVSIEKELKRRKENLIRYEESWNDLVNQRKNILGGKSTEEVEKYFVDMKNRYTNDLELVRSKKDKQEKSKAEVIGVLSQQKRDIEVYTKDIYSLHHAVDSWILNNKQSLTLPILEDLMSRSPEWIRNERELLNNLKNKELTLEATWKERKNRLEKHLQLEDKPSEGQNKDILIQLFTENEAKRENLTKQLTALEVSLSKHKEGKERIKAFEKELEIKRELSENWKKLNVLLGSADGAKFKTIAQGYTLDVLLGYANKHLEELTKRYKLERIGETLALQVVDNDSLGEVRSVHTLSGGESFLISLSLALGLSSLSSNQIKIESLFIDEGFGSLDMDTLSIAMDALENLQTQGRKIGVISHVAEMMERIAAQVQVIKSAQGKSIIHVTG